VDALASSLAAARAGGSAGSSASGGAARQSARGKDPVEEIRDTVKLREQLAQIHDLKEAVQSGGSLAKALGFTEASKHAEKVARGLEFVEKSAKGASASIKLIGAAFIPVTVGVGTFAGAMIGLQRLLEVTTGTTNSLANSVRLMGLGAAESLAKVEQGYYLLKGLTEGNPLNYFKEIQESEAEIRGLQETIREIQAEGKDAAPWQGWGPELQRVKGDLQQFGAELGSALGPVLGGFTSEGRDLFGGVRKAIREVGDELRGALAPLNLKDAGSGFGRLSVLAEQLEPARQARRDELKAIEQQIEKLREMGAAQSSIVALQRELVDLRETESTLTSAENRDLYARANETMQVVGQQGGVAFASGIDQALADATPNLQQSVIEALGIDENGEVITSFRDLLGNVERLFKENPLQFILTGLGLAGGGMGGGLGFASGGRVPGAGGAPSFAHLFAQGFARGGRPSWLPASDTVAAWLTPGEWVMPVASVRKYGASVMEAFRQGIVDPGIAQALAHGVPVPAPVSTPAPRGYASGGAVAGGSGGGGMPTVLPVLPADGPTVERLFHGGRNEILKFLHENGVAFNR
jgi:hypothetical protein